MYKSLRKGYFWLGLGYRRKKDEMKGGMSMTIQILKFEFEYCGFCLWSNHGAFNHKKLPISDKLLKDLDGICQEFNSILDWSDPHATSPWTRKQCADFFDRAEIILEKLKKELDGKYEIISCLDEDRRIYLHENTFSDD